MDTLYINELRPHVMAVKQTLTSSVKPDDKKALLLLDILIEHWETDTKITQQQIAKMIPSAGHHELWEIRQGAKKDTTLRKVRSIIEKQLRKKHLLPVLSTPGKLTVKANSAGYWLARAKWESAQYCKRRLAEINKTYRSSVKTLDAVRKVCRVGE